ncbi:MAG TPA: oligosaccharide flippase family protein [Solirubrobacteraceae bacterium]|nr:oligosaccharide flippase family protein [Solirubrobacteraceae bacterium]
MSSSSAGYSHLRQFATTLLRHSSVYTGGRLAALVLSFAQTLILVQFLDPAEFGQIAIVVTLGSLLTLIVMVTCRRGTVSRTFGRHSDEDDDDGDEEQEEDKTPRNPRDAFGTGFLMMSGIGLVGVGFFALGGTALLGTSSALGGGGMAVGGAIGAVTALVELFLIVPFQGGRPHVFVALLLLRSALVLAFSVSIVAQGGGALGVLVGQLAALILTLAVSMVLFKSIYRLRFRHSEVKPILVLSARRVPRTVSMWVLRNVDVLVLATVAPAASVGIYRLASRLTMPLSFPAQSFFRAWLPLERSPLVRAADQARGRPIVRAMVVTYLVFGIVGVLLALSVSIDALDELVPPDYAETLAVLPWLLAMILAMINLDAAHRFARMRARRRVYNWTLVGAAALSFPAVYLGAKAFGPRGAAAGLMVVFLGASANLWIRSQRGPARLPLQYRRMGATVLVAVGCFALQHFGSMLWPAGRVVMSVSAVILYPIALIGLGIVPKAQRRGLTRVRTTFVGRRPDSEILQGVTGLAPDQQAALRAALATGQTRRRPEPVAVDQDEQVWVAALGALRSCSGTRRRPETLELAIARYLFSPQDVLDRNHAAMELYSAKIKPTEIATLERWRDGARKAID